MNLEDDLMIDQREILQKRFPWLEDVRFVSLLQFYAKAAVLFKPKRFGLRALARSLLSLSGRARIKYSFFGFPLEYEVYRLVKRWQGKRSSKGQKHLWSEKRQDLMLESGFARHLHQKRVAFIVDTLKALEQREKRPLHILDLGCGDGAVTKHIRSSSPDHIIVAVDDDRTRLERAKAACPDVQFLEADARKLGFADRRFDLIVMHHVLEHIGEDKKVLAECHRLLKDQGYLLLGVPNEAGLMGRISRALHKRLYARGEHVNFYSLESMQRFIRDAGFEEVGHKKFGFLFPLYYLHLLLISNKFIFDLGDRLAQKIDAVADSLIFVARKNSR